MFTLNSRILFTLFFAIFSFALATNLSAQDSDDEEAEYDVKLYNMISKSPKSFGAWRTANPTAEANLMGADLSGLNFSGLNLSGVNFKGASLTGANFTNANLVGADFSEADLGEDENMSVNFEGADLTNANFYNADATKVYFTKAKLINVNFKESELVGASFKNADASGANFKGADINGITLDGTIFDENTVLSSAEAEGVQVKSACKVKVGGQMKNAATFKEIQSLVK